MVRNRLYSPEVYARHIGVSIGKNCLVDTRNWGSEPYLITIGDNCQITHGVSIYTHGGGQAIRWKYPVFDMFGKVVIVDWVYIGANYQILPGVTIGKAIVAADDVFANLLVHTILGGILDQYIYTIEDFYERNKKRNVRTKELSIEEKKLLFLAEDKLICK